MRLFLLAAHLQSEEIQTKYPRNKFLHFVHNDIILFCEDDGVHFNFLFPFLIQELPNLFNEWTVVNNKVVYTPAPELSDSSALCEFLGMESEEFHELFIPKDGARELQRLSPNATPIQIGDRIFDFLEHVLAQKTKNEPSNQVQSLKPNNMKPDIGRLRKLAAHLTTGPLSMPYIELLQEIGRQPHNEKYPPCLPFVYNELPHLFSEWEHWPSYGLIIYGPEPTLSIDEALLVFFGIPDELSKHCFYPGNKNVAKYGGKELTLFSRPRDVANQIHQLIEKLEGNV